MFKRNHHVRIATVLQALDGDLLARHHCWFGGGTAIALLRGEYRESVDIDFLVSDLAGYRALRLMLTEQQSVLAICRPGLRLTAVAGIQTDQYGIRTMLRVSDVEIKFEIVNEGRVQFATGVKA